MSGTYGSVVSWTLRNLFIPRDDLIKAFKERSIDIPIKEVSPQAYLKLACDQAVTDGLLRRIGFDEHRVSYAVVHEDTDVKSANWKGQQVEAITFDKTTGEVFFRENSDIARDIRSAYSKVQGGLVTLHISALLKQVVDSVYGLPLRDSGGVYFVSNAGKPTLDAVEDAIRSCLNRHGVLRIHRFGVISGVSEAKDLADIYCELASADIQKVRDEVSIYLQDLVHAKPSTFARRVAQISDLLKSVDVYANLFSGVLTGDKLKAFDELRKHANSITGVLRRSAAACLELRKQARKNRVTILEEEEEE